MVEEDHGKRGPSGHAEVETRRLLTRTQSLQQVFLSLSFLTQKAMSTTEDDIQKLKHLHRFSNILKTMQHSQAV